MKSDNKRAHINQSKLYQLMMCDNLSLYKSFVPSTPILPQTESTTMNLQFFPAYDEDNEHRSCMSVKRKLSAYEDNSSSITTLNHISTSLDCNNSDESDEDENDDNDNDDDDDDDGSSGDDETLSDDESHHVNSSITPCTIIQRRHSDTIHTSYGTPIVKRRCTYSSMHDDEQKRSVLVESYRKLRGVKKPKLQVSLLICNLIKRLEKTFTKTPPLRQQQQQQQQEHVQYYQHHRTTYRSSSSDSIYMSPLSSTLVNDEIETTNQQYSSSHSSNYDSDKVLLPVNDLRSTSSMYHSSSTDAYWLAQSNFAVPVVSISDDDDVDVSLHGGGDYLDLSDNTLSSSFSSSSSSSSNDCCCSSTSSPTITKLLVDNNNNNNNNDGYFIYHHHHHHHTSSTTGQTFFYPHNGNNTVDIITTA
ncbi:unnamed protein product [Rotaria sordida]|uniref:SERTA domain-containing protein n=1 Tax=Rotaria sordida TaxID=392033 RepID=A0A813S8H3_9BILA|nr:unnamed protein product [Rotaria sordida]CAF0805963.1 unnamed protein product [Rotaria sordida]